MADLADASKGWDNWYLQDSDAALYEVATLLRNVKA
jgi:hypothetical protein